MIFSKFKKYGDVINSHDLVKFIAITMMIIDHAGHYLLSDIEALRLLGRLSFPLFFFLIGYSLSNKINNGLLLSASVIIVTEMALGENILPLDILITVIFCRLIMKFLLKFNYLSLYLKKQPLTLLLIYLVWYLPIYFLLDYGTIGLMFVSVGYFVRNNFCTSAHKTFLIATLALYALTQSINFDFNNIQILSLITGMTYIGYFMYNYKFEIYNISNKILRYPTMFIARYSLYVYTAHLVAFKIIAAVLKIN